MREINHGDVTILVEPDENNRHYNLVRGWITNEHGEPVAFCGKFLVMNNFTDDEIKALFTEEHTNFIKDSLKKAEEMKKKEGGQI